MQLHYEFWYTEFKFNLIELENSIAGGHELYAVLYEETWIKASI